MEAVVRLGCEDVKRELNSLSGISRKFVSDLFRFSEMYSNKQNINK